VEHNRASASNNLQPRTMESREVDRIAILRLLRSDFGMRDSLYSIGVHQYPANN